MSKHLGNFMSPIKNPLIKQKRIIEMMREVYDAMCDIENLDAVNQENYERQLEIVERKLLATQKALDEELGLNNELIKENNILHKRTQQQNTIIEEQKDTIEVLINERDSLKEYKRKTRIKFRKWLDKRLTIKKKNKVKLEKLK